MEYKDAGLKHLLYQIERLDNSDEDPFFMVVGKNAVLVTYGEGKFPRIDLGFITDSVQEYWMKESPERTFVEKLLSRHPTENTIDWVRGVTTCFSEASKCPWVIDFYDLSSEPDVVVPWTNALALSYGFSAMLDLLQDTVLKVVYDAHTTEYFDSLNIIYSKMNYKDTGVIDLLESIENLGVRDDVTNISIRGNRLVVISEGSRGTEWINMGIILRTEFFPLHGQVSRRIQDRLLKMNINPQKIDWVISVNSDWGEYSHSIIPKVLRLQWFPDVWSNKSKFEYGFEILRSIT